MQGRRLRFRNSMGWLSLRCFLQRAPLWVLVGVFVVACSSPSGQEQGVSVHHRWSIQLAGPEEPPGLLTYPEVRDGKAFCLSARSGLGVRLLCVDIPRKRLHWQRPLLSDTASVPYYNTRMLSDGRLVYFVLKNTLYAVRWADGEEVGKWDLGGSVVEAPVFDHRGNIFISSNDWMNRQSYVYRLQPGRDSAEVWFALEWPEDYVLLLQAPLVMKNGVFLAYSAQHQRSGHTYSRWLWLDAASSSSVLNQGEVYPEKKHGHGPTKPPIACGQEVIVVAYDHILRLNPAEGKERWRIVLPRDMLTSHPLLEEGKLYAAMEDGYLYCIDASNGQLLWKSRLSGTPSRIVKCREHLYVIGGGDGLLHIFEASKGTVVGTEKSPDHDYLPYGHFHRFIGVDCRRRTLLLFDGRYIRAYEVL